MGKIIDFKTPKKKKNNNQSKKVDTLFDKSADIYTNNNGEYHIRKNRIYICGSNYYGKVYTISSNKYSRDNVHIIKHIYPCEDNRFRFLLVNFKNARKFKTIEKLPDGKERRIAVIEKFDDVSEYVCSIGDIKKFKSDLISEEKKKIIDHNYIKKLILKPEKNNNKKDRDKKKVA